MARKPLMQETDTDKVNDFDPNFVTGYLQSLDTELKLVRLFSRNVLKECLEYTGSKIVKGIQNGELDKTLILEFIKLYETFLK